MPVESCVLCGEPSTRKVAEEYDTFGRELLEMRHPLTTRVCESCFVKLFGEWGVRLVDDFDRGVRERQASATAKDPERST